MKSRRTSLVWLHFTQEPGEIAKCKFCNNKYSYKTTITNLRKHLKCKHPSIRVADVMSVNKKEELEDTARPPTTDKLEGLMEVIYVQSEHEPGQQEVLMEEEVILEEEIIVKYPNLRIGFIGGGNMAKAICEGIVRKGIIKYSQVNVSGPNLDNLNWWKNHGANVTVQNGTVLAKSDTIFLAVKPNVLPTAIANMFDTLRKPVKSKLFVSILGGITLEALESCLYRPEIEGARVIRVMPNTPMMVGEGCSVFCPGQMASEEDIELVKTLLEVSSVCKEVPESLINAVSALAGSGPAFVYLIIEALSDGGVNMGIPRAMATNFAAQTVLGAAKMVLDSGKHTGALKDEVCSPGGTTISGIHALEKAGVRGAIMNAIEAAANKSAELGKKK